MRQNDRMEIDELLYHMTTRTGDRKPKKNLRTHIEKLQRITVHDFYDMPFTMRSKGFVEAIGISRDSVRAVFDGRKEGLFRILESCISQLMPGQSIKTLTMKTLANAISEALEDESLPLGKRMEWYELCFVLVEEMDTSIDGADILTGALTDGGEKPGARLNWGAPGLSRRVEECRSKGKGSAGKKRRRPLGIEDLLKTMNAGKDRLPSDFFLMDMDRYIFEWNRAKAELDAPDDSVSDLECIGESEFRNKAKCFGFPIHRSDNVVKYIRKLVDSFGRQRELERCRRASVRKVSRLYELCYELVHLMADYDMGLEHRTLMEMRKDEICTEGEELMEYEIGESERMERIGDELLMLVDDAPEEWDQ